MPPPTPRTVHVPGRSSFVIPLAPARAPVAAPFSPNDLTQVALGKITDIKKRKARIEEDLVAIGLALIELSKPTLYLALKCDSFDDLVDQHLRGVLSRETARQLKTVVEQVPAADLHTLGRRKAWEVVFLAEKAQLSINDALRITIDGLRLHDPAINAGTIHKLAEALGVQDRPVPPPRPSAPDTPETKQARHLATKMQRNLRRAGATDATVRARRVEGVWSLRLDIPVSQSSHLTIT